MTQPTSPSLNPDPATTTAMGNPRPERYHGKPAPEEGAGFLVTSSPPESGGVPGGRGGLNSRKRGPLHLPLI